MSKRVAVPLEVGGMDTSGDVVRKGNAASRKIRNLAIRPGPRLEKRHGFLRDGTIAVGTNGALGGFYRFNDERNARIYLLFGNAFTSTTRRAGGYRNNSAAWVQFSSGTTAGGFVDATTAFNRVYGIYAADSTTNSGSFSWDGTTEVADPFIIKMGGRSIDFFQRRLWLAAPTVEVNNLLANTLNSEISYQFEDAAAWTASVGTPTISIVGNARSILWTAANDVLVSANVGTTSGVQYVTWVACFRALSSGTAPMTLSIENSAGTTTYAALEIELPNITTNSEFIQYLIQARIPDAVTWRLKIANGFTVTSAKAGALVSFVASESTTNSANNTDPTLNIGHVAVYGRFVPPFMAPVYVATKPTKYYPTRIYGCETDEPASWRSIRYYDITGIPGAINLIRADGDRMFIFKDDAIFIYRGNDSADFPLQYERTVPNFGCLGPKAFTRFEGRMYFIGPNGVYEWEPNSGNPVELSGEPMREELFNANTVASPICEVDERNREVWCYLQAGKIHIYNLAMKMWFYYTITGASDAELTVTDLAFLKPYGESVPEMYAMMAQSTDIVKLRVGQTQDNITGTSRDVVSEWELPIVNSDAPWKDFQVEQVGLYHSISGSQSASLSEAAFSHDNGTTWDKYVRFDPTTVVSGAVDQVRVSLRQTPVSRRGLLRLKHTGLAGPSYFNSTGAFAELDLKEDGIQRANPTVSASAL